MLNAEQTLKEIAEKTLATIAAFSPCGNAWD